MFKQMKPRNQNALGMALWAIVIIWAWILYCKIFETTP